MILKIRSRVDDKPKALSLLYPKTVFGGEHDSTLNDNTISTITRSTTEVNLSFFGAALRKSKSAKDLEKYIDICNVVLMFCDLPHSSVAAERQFMLLCNIKTKFRNCLPMQTTGCLMRFKEILWRFGTSIDS